MDDAFGFLSRLIEIHFELNYESDWNCFYRKPDFAAMKSDIFFIYREKELKIYH